MSGIPTHPNFEALRTQNEANTVFDHAVSNGVDTTGWGIRVPAGEDGVYNLEKPLFSDVNTGETYNGVINQDNIDKVVEKYGTPVYPIYDNVVDLDSRRGVTESSSKKKVASAGVGAVLGVTGALMATSEAAAGDTDKIPARGTECPEVDAEPEEGVLANYTVTEPDGFGFLNGHTPGASPLANSSLNHDPGETDANMIFVEPGDIETSEKDGVCVSTLVGSHAVIDVVGYTAPGMVRKATPNGQADRILDTRLVGSPTNGNKIGSRGTVCADTGALEGEGVFVNLTVTEPIGYGFLNGHGPDVAGDKQKLANSSINYAPGETAANMIWLEPGPLGAICVSTLVSAHAIFDVVGYTAPGAVRQATTSGQADRVMDTRIVQGGITKGNKILPRDTESPVVSARPGEGVLYNLTVTEPEAPGFLNGHILGAAPLDNSSVNYLTGKTDANMIWTPAKADSSGQQLISVSSLAAAHAIVDVMGYTAPGMIRLATPNGQADRILDTRLREIVTLISSSGSDFIAKNEFVPSCYYGVDELSPGFYNVVRGWRIDVSGLVPGRLFDDSFYAYGGEFTSETTFFNYGRGPNEGPYEDNSTNSDGRYSTADDEGKDFIENSSYLVSLGDEELEQNLAAVSKMDGRVVLNKYSDVIIDGRPQHTGTSEYVFSIVCDLVEV